MAADKPPTKGPGDDPSPPPGYADWPSYIASLVPPVSQVPTNPVAGTNPAAGWRPPQVSQYQFPQGLLNQIAQSYQPLPSGASFGRWGFSQGTPTPPFAPPGWGRAPVQGTPWNRPPVGWNAPQGAYVPPSVPQSSGFPGYSPGYNPGYGPGVGGSPGGSQGGGYSPPPQYNPPPPPSGGGSAPPAPQQEDGPWNNYGKPPTKAGGTLPAYTPPQGFNYGVPTWGGQPTPSQTPIQQGAQPAQVGWSPDPSKNMQQNMASYQAYISQSPASFLAGFNSQPTQQAKIEFIMRAPPTISSQLMNDPQVQQALGGANFRQNFMQGYYNAPAR